MPLNFTHLGLYMGTSGRQIFEPRKKWKETNKGRLHRDEEEEEATKPKEAVVFFTFAFVTNFEPHNLINGIRNEWETHGGSKLMVKDLQSHKSKVAFVLYFVFMSTPHKYILQTLREILQEAAEIQAEGAITTDNNAAPITIPDISIRS